MGEFTKGDYMKDVAEIVISFLAGAGMAMAFGAKLKADILAEIAKLEAAIKAKL